MLGAAVVVAVLFVEENIVTEPAQHKLTDEEALLVCVNDSLARVLVAEVHMLA